MDAEAAAAIARLERRVAEMADELNLYKQSGLDALRTRALAFHHLPYVTEAPTEADEDGSPRVVEDGGFYFYARFPSGWKRVALT